MPSWSRDGRWIYFGSKRTGDWQIWKVPSEGGQAVQVTKNGGDEAFESPDGKWLYYIKPDNRSGLWRVPVEGGEETLAHELLKPVVLRGWAVVEEGIYFVKPDRAIAFFDFAMERVTQLAALEQRALWPTGLTVSPNGRKILYTQVDLGGGDIMLLENFR